jgi:hypothetical protein
MDESWFRWALGVSEMMRQMHIKITEGMKMSIVLRAQQYGCTESEFVRWCIADALDRKEGPIMVAVTKSLAEY